MDLDHPFFLSATWHVPVNGKLHKIGFEHVVMVGVGIIRVDDKIVLHESSYPGKPARDTFKVSGVNCIIKVQEISEHIFQANLEVDGRSFKDYQEQFNQKFITWKPITVAGKDVSVVLDKETLEVWRDGNAIDTTRDFTESGIATFFQLDSTPCKILSDGTSGKRTMTHILYANDVEVPIVVEVDERPIKLDLTGTLKSKKKNYK
ncbi:hypothetical protein GCK72_011250 [Caenorhabditis remanei]|uniref:Uncharacterized protein n=1 Tax=Caenorhabditis remanei TaxID=31234 RepID=A0A6A5H792_CAERE|nr:hypothetical protein GCK72_011250 [Caenorhabditis remanei]KAF1762985.1 hypothetical protein GCK72_011250 [Caenorhabditis remanei]